MMWTKLDAKLRQNRKIKKALRRDPMSILLWVWVLVGIGHEQTDGFVTMEEIEDAAHELFMDEDQVARCVKILQDVNLVHDRRAARKCMDCSVLADHIASDGFYFHDFTDQNPTKEQAVVPIKALRWKREQGLKHSRSLCRQITERDGDRCCYCDVQLDWSKRSGENDGGTYDHLDPNLFTPNFGNFLENIVLACRTCNGRKKDRTPEEWVEAGGRPLLRDPRKTKPRPGRAQVADQGAPYPHGRDAHDTGRSGSEAGRDLGATSSNGHGANGHGRQT